MKKVKCQIIPAYVYDGIPPTAFEDSNHRYIKGHKGHFIRVTRKTCSECGNPAVFVGIFKYKKHLRVERLCQDHATLRQGSSVSATRTRRYPTKMEQYEN